MKQSINRSASLDCMRMSGFPSSKQWPSSLIVIALTIDCLIAGAPASAKWARPEMVPVATLKKTFGDYLRTHPRDAEATYMLGRVFSAAFAEDTEKVGVYRGDKLPEVPHQAGITRPHRSAALSERARGDYREALRYYSAAVRLDPNNPLAQLGLGFQCEEGLRYPALWPDAAQVLGIAANSGALKQEALARYRASYRLSKRTDQRRGTFMYETYPISQEAAEGIVRLIGNGQSGASERAEVAEIKSHLRFIKSHRRGITPILIDFAGRGSLPGLLAPGSHVRFDLAGDAIPRDWPWVRPDTGILVWDPKGAGHIESGLQLFGTVTWWMFWQDGYAPLAALDVDHNGWLEGAELKGIAVWFDRNGDGVSQPGEVVSLASLGVRRIGVRTEGRRDGALWSSAGVEMADGSLRATYDWTPKSLAAH